MKRRKAFKKMTKNYESATLALLFKLYKGRLGVNFKPISEPLIYD